MKKVPSWVDFGGASVPDDSEGCIFYAGRLFLAGLMIGCACMLNSGCCSLVARTNIPDGEVYPATKINYATLYFVREHDSLAATVLAIDFIPSVATDTLLLPVDLFVALKKEIYP